MRPTPTFAGERVFFFFFFEQPQWVEIGSYSIRVEFARASNDAGRGADAHEPSDEDVRMSDLLTGALERELSHRLDFHVRLGVTSLTRGSLIQIGPFEGDAGGILNWLVKLSGIAASIAAGTLSFTQAIASYPEARKGFPMLQKDIVDAFDRAIDAIIADKSTGFTIVDAKMTPRDMAELEADTDEKLRLLDRNKKPGDGGPKNSR